MKPEEIRAVLKALEEKRKAKYDAAMKALDDDNLEESRKLKETVKELDKEITETRSDLDKAEEAEKRAKTQEPKQEPAQEPQQRSATPSRAVGENAAAKNVTSAEVRALRDFVEGRDIAGGSLTTNSDFVVFPEEIVTDILKLKEREYNLDQYVTVRNVPNGSGKFPVVRQSSVAALPEVAELAENPELAVKPFFMLNYDIKTYRGYFLISKEAIQDSAIDVIAELKQWMARTIAATRNSAILNLIQNGGPGEDGGTTNFARVDATGVDGLKDAVNLNILPNYENNLAIMSQSAFAALDKLKDGNGNYLIQPDVKESSAQRLLGARVEILPDEMLPDNTGAHQILLGNLKDGIMLFNRLQYQAQWTDYMHFGEALMVAVRQDARIIDKNAVVVVNFTPGDTTPTV